MLTAALALLLLALIAAAWWLYTPDAPRAALEARWAAAPSRFVEAAGLRLHLRDTGPREAPAILFLHGFGTSLHTWEEVAAALEDGFRVIRLDLPGFGLTGPDPSGDYSDSRAGAVLAALLDRLGVARAHVVGSSMGGRIAWRFAAERPARVERLVLMAPDGFASPGLDYGTPPRVGPLLRLLPYALPRALVRAGMAPAYADPAALTPARLERAHALLLAPGVRRAILARMRQHILVPPEPFLARIAAPTLLLWGERDAMVPASNAADYLRALRDARSVVLPGIGHVPMEEAPEATARAIRAFLSPP
ncbi:MAG: alpha/beta fold hydrolase [Roseococcus sp.]|nr:alpha/beta fold hydrolase [Roseococcus sp.]